MKNTSFDGHDSLHPKQQSLYGFLRKNKSDDDLTLDEMREALEVHSLNTVVYHLRQLEKKGYIRRDSMTGRFQALSDPLDDIVYLNLYRSLSHSSKGHLKEKGIEERIPFPAKQLRMKPETFLIKAEDDAMRPMINEGDLVMVDPAVYAPRDGEVAVVNYNGEMKIRRLVRQSDCVVLWALNPSYPPIVVSAKDSGAQPIGVARGIIRNFSDDDLKFQKSRYY